MNQQPASNFHLDYYEVNRHWCDTSERYAGGDALLTAMQNNWRVEAICYRQEYWHAGTRQVTVFHFDLVNGNDRMTMPVITTPFVRRMIRELSLEVRSYDERALENRADPYEGTT